MHNNNNEIKFYKNGKLDCIYQASTYEDYLLVQEIKEKTGCYVDFIDQVNLFITMGWIDNDKKEGLN